MDSCFSREQISPCGYRSVTNVALSASLGVLPVAETHKRGYLVHANPVDVPVLLGKRG